MKTTLFFIATMPFILLIACSDPQNAPTAANEKVSVHEPGWMAPASSSFHGTILAAKKFDASECRQCHGSQFDGGISAVSCKQCHTNYPHPASFVGAHRNYIKSIHYDITTCKPCHGQDYGTTKVDNSCQTCHTKAGGPESCTTCHGNLNGDAADLINVAPPRGLDGESSSTSPAVGAHQAHSAYYTNLTTATACQQCHTLPQNFADAGHLGTDDRAEALLQGALANLATEGGARVPNGAYNVADNTCMNTYCHGNWGLLKSGSKYPFIYAADKIEGAAASPKWTDATTVACGTCHGLPPTGHNPFDLGACGTCHQGVIDPFGKIIDATKHVNGKVNLFNEEYSMF